MNFPLRDLEPPEAAEPPAPPQVLVRVLVTPPGAPWSQARAARLDAQHAAPLPVAELMHQVRRLAPWRGGEPGRYAALYIRADEYREPFETTVDVDGKPLSVRFGAARRTLPQLGPAAGVLLMLVLSGALLGGGVFFALRARSAAVAQLEVEEQLAQSRLRLSERAQDRARLVTDVRKAAGPARPLGDVVADLTWVATSKTPEARIVAVHWERGLLAVEARGEAAPFQTVDRLLERSAKPLRPGVWLWAVGGHEAASAAPEPVAAEMRP